MRHPAPAADVVSRTFRRSTRAQALPRQLFHSTRGSGSHTTTRSASGTHLVRGNVMPPNDTHNHHQAQNCKTPSAKELPQMTAREASTLAPSCPLRESSSAALTSCPAAKGALPYSSRQASSRCVVRRPINRLPLGSKLSNGRGWQAVTPGWLHP